MSFNTLLKNKQRRLLSKTWRDMLTAREIEKNNYHVTGNIKKAHEFAYTAVNYKPPVIVEEAPLEPIVIYSII